MPVSGELLTLVSIGAVESHTLVTAASRPIGRLVAVAEYSDVSEVLIEMTILAVGTSLPEIGSHFIASLGILSGVLDYQATSAVVTGGNTGTSTVQQLFLVGILSIGCSNLNLTESFVRESCLPMLGVFVVSCCSLDDDPNSSTPISRDRFTSKFLIWFLGPPVDVKYPV